MDENENAFIGGEGMKRQVLHNDLYGEESILFCFDSRENISVIGRAKESTLCGPNFVLKRFGIREVVRSKSLIEIDIFCFYSM